MALSITAGDDFTRFVREQGRRLQHGLIAALGREVGIEAASEALAYGWEHWERIGAMENPVGYLFTVGRNWGRHQFRARSAVPFPEVTLVTRSEPMVEPALPAALAGLSERQRIATMLVYGADWTTAEVAVLLGVDRGTVHKHAERGLRKLRRALEVHVNA